MLKSAVRTNTPATCVEGAIADMCTIGVMIRDFPAARAWLEANPNASLVITSEVLAENIRGEDLIAGIKPEFAALLRTQRKKLFHERAVEVGSKGELVDETLKLEAALLSGNLIGPNGARMRLSIAAAARHFGLPILSGNLFFRRLADHVALPHGVYDVYRQRWIVPAMQHA